MKKVVEKGEKFVATELKRLQTMVAGGKVKADKVDEFYYRINILKYVSVKNTTSAQRSACRQQTSCIDIRVSLLRFLLRVSLLRFLFGALTGPFRAGRQTRRMSCKRLTSG